MARAASLEILMATKKISIDPSLVMQELSRADRRLAGIIRRAGPFPAEPRSPRHPFPSLLQAIAYQQITGKAAETILGRVKALFGHSGMPTPQEILNVAPEDLRAAGFSRQKIAAAKDLAAKVLDGTVPSLGKLQRMGEEEIIERLTAVRGIGEWSAQMFLMFRLGRPDILPANDYGLRKGFARVYGHADMPKPQVILEHGERWRPYRTYASWYLWRAAEEKSKKSSKAGAGKTEGKSTAKQRAPKKQRSVSGRKKAK
jgi:DNA-3-methyladenine glycosylase II